MFKRFQGSVHVRQLNRCQHTQQLLLSHFVTYNISHSDLSSFFCQNHVSQHSTDYYWSNDHNHIVYKLVDTIRYRYSLFCFDNCVDHLYYEYFDFTDYYLVYYYDTHLFLNIFDYNFDWLDNFYFDNYYDYYLTYYLSNDYYFHIISVFSYALSI